MVMKMFGRLQCCRPCHRTTLVLLRQCSILGQHCLCDSTSTNSDVDQSRMSIAFFVKQVMTVIRINFFVLMDIHWELEMLLKKGNMHKSSLLPWARMMNCSIQMLDEQSCLQNHSFSCCSASLCMVDPSIEPHCIENCRHSHLFVHMKLWASEWTERKNQFGREVHALSLACFSLLCWSAWCICMQNFHVCALNDCPGMLKNRANMALLSFCHFSHATVPWTQCWSLLSVCDIVHILKGSHQGIEHWDQSESCWQVPWTNSKQVPFCGNSHAFSCRTSVPKALFQQQVTTFANNGAVMWIVCSGWQWGHPKCHCIRNQHFVTCLRVVNEWLDCGQKLWCFLRSEMSSFR